MNSTGSNLPASAGVHDEVSALGQLCTTTDFLRQVTAVAPCILYVHDLIQERTVWTNRQFAELLGYSGADLARTGSELLRTLMHPADWTRYVEHREKFRTLPDHAVAVIEFRVRSANGAWRWIESRDMVFDRLADGAPRQIAGAALDITARREAEANLRESEARFRAMADGLPLIVWVHDADGEQEFVNQTFCTFFGVQRDAMKGGSWKMLMHPQDAPQYTEKFLTAVRQRHPFNAEVRVRNSEGAWRYIESWALPRFSDAGQFLGFIGTSADITPRKEAEALLRASEERHRKTFEHAPVGIAQMSLDGRFERFNQAVCDITGYGEEELHLMNFAQLTHPDDIEPDWTQARRLLAGEIQAYTLEKRYVRKSGEVMWVCLTASLVRDAERNPQHFIAIIQDIASRKETEAALASAQMRLKAHAAELEQMVSDRTALLHDSLVELEHFSYTVAHDLRAPLRAINQFSTILLQEHSAGLEAEARDLLQRILRAGNRMHALTTDLLKFTGISALPQGALTETSIEATLAELLDLDPNLRVAADYQIESPLLRVKGHETLLRQILANLIENAVKYCKPGVRPVITIRTVRGSPLDDGGGASANFRSAHWNDTATRDPGQPGAAGYVRLWVEDNGIGISPAYHQRIFGIFERLNADNGKGGTGIGLAIVAKAAERMRGRCGVESEPGRGSRFWVELEGIAR